VTSQTAGCYAGILVLPGYCAVSAILVVVVVVVVVVVAAAAVSNLF